MKEIKCFNCKKIIQIVRPPCDDEVTFCWDCYDKLEMEKKAMKGNIYVKLLKDQIEYLEKINKKLRESDMIKKKKKPAYLAYQKALI